MEEIKSLAHANWECKAHVVWIPKYRRKALNGELRKPIGPAQRECVVEEGHLQLDHVHMLLSIPRSTPSSRSSGTARGRALSPLREATSGGGRTSRASTFGRAAIRSPR